MTVIRVDPVGYGRVARAYEWLRGTQTGLVALALAVGAGAGAGAVVFRYLILAFTSAFAGRRDYSPAGHASYGYFQGLGFWFVVFTPVIGGLIYGPLIHFFAREARGHGVPEVMFAVAERGGRIRQQVAVIKSLASTLCVGSGGSVGRDFEAESFGVVVLSSVVADIIGRAAFGSQAFLHVLGFELRSQVGYPLYAGLGLLAALVGFAFVCVLYGMEDRADPIWRGHEWLRPAAGGILLGPGRR
jgi:chloride channel protein, CIC family